LSVKAAAIFVVIMIIILIVAIFYWSYYNTMDKFDRAWDEADKAMAKGCVPLTSDQYGIPTTYRCPPGVTLD
jgi:hypothetical protein